MCRFASQMGSMHGYLLPTTHDPLPTTHYALLTTHDTSQVVDWMRGRIDQLAADAASFRAAADGLSSRLPPEEAEALHEALAQLQEVEAQLRRELTFAVEQLREQRARVMALEKELAGGDSAAKQRVTLLEAEIRRLQEAARAGGAALEEAELRLQQEQALRAELEARMQAMLEGDAAAKAARVEALAAAEVEMSRLRAELEGRTAKLDAFKREVGTEEATRAQRWWTSELRCVALEVAALELAAAHMPARLRTCVERTLCAAIDVGDPLRGADWDELWERATCDARFLSGLTTVPQPQQQLQQQQLTALFRDALQPRGDPEAEAAAVALREENNALCARAEAAEAATKAAEAAAEALRQQLETEQAARAAADRALAAGQGALGEELTNLKSELAVARARVVELEGELRVQAEQAPAAAAAAAAAAEFATGARSRAA